MKDYEDEAFDELEKAQQRKVATGVTDGSKVTIDRAKLIQAFEALRTFHYAMIDAGVLDKQEVLNQGLTAAFAIKEALEDV